MKRPGEGALTAETRGIFSAFAAPLPEPVQGKTMVRKGIRNKIGIPARVWVFPCTVSRSIRRPQGRKNTSRLRRRGTSDPPVHLPQPVATNQRSPPVPCRPLSETDGSVTPRPCALRHRTERDGVDGEIHQVVRDTDRQGSGQPSSGVRRSGVVGSVCATADLRSLAGGNPRVFCGPMVSEATARPARGRLGRYGEFRSSHADFRIVVFAWLGSPSGDCRGRKRSSDFGRQGALTRPLYRLSPTGSRDR